MPGRKMTGEGSGAGMVVEGWEGGGWDSVGGENRREVKAVAMETWKQTAAVKGSRPGERTERNAALTNGRGRFSPRSRRGQVSSPPSPIRFLIAKVFQHARRDWRNAALPVPSRARTDPSSRPTARCRCESLIQWMPKATSTRSRRRPFRRGIFPGIGPVPVSSIGQGDPAVGCAKNLGLPSGVRRLNPCLVSLLTMNTRTPHIYLCFVARVSSPTS